jgi:ribosomal protein L37AE/L43A
MTCSGCTLRQHQASTMHYRSTNYDCHACTTPEAKKAAAKIGGAILFGW